MARIFGSDVYGSATFGGTAHVVSLTSAAAASTSLSAGRLVSGNLSAAALAVAIADGEIVGAGVVTGSAAIVASASASLSAIVDGTAYNLEAFASSVAHLNGERETGLEAAGVSRSQGMSRMSGMRIQQSGCPSQAHVVVRGVFGADVSGIRMAIAAHVQAICDGRLLWEPEVTPDDIWTQQKVA